MKKKQIVLIVLAVLIIFGGLLHRTLTQDVNHHGTTKLMRALSNHEKWKKITKIVDKSKTLNLPDRNGNTALFYAVRHRTDKNEIEYLLKAGADINAQNKQAQSVLFEAAHFNPSAEVITFLCEKGLPVNARDINGNTPLILAARYNTSSVVRALLNEGADLELKGEDGLTAREELAINEHLSEQEKTDFRQAMLVLSILEARLAAKERRGLIQKGKEIKKVRAVESAPQALKKEVQKQSAEEP